jgi:hypothetical protein
MAGQGHSAAAGSREVRLYRYEHRFSTNGMKPAATSLLGRGRAMGAPAGVRSATDPRRWARLGGATAHRGQFLLFLCANSGLSERPRTRAREIYAGAWALVVVHELLDMEGYHRAFHSQALRFLWHLTERSIEDPETAREEIKRRHDLMSARKLAATAESSA